MNISKEAVIAVVLSATCSMALGCSEEKKAAAAATAAPTATPAPAPTPVAPPKAEKPKRPEKIDTEVTAARRAKVESANAEAKGFLVASELETKLKANKTLKAKEAGVTVFDKMASGHWVLFAGPLSNPTDSGFDLGITYTPQIQGDVMGMSRQWFPVTFSDVKGYDSSAFKSGQMVVVLAKYIGKQKAENGQELVAAGTW
jgi:hypothetical protein